MPNTGARTKGPLVRRSGSFPETHPSAKLTRPRGAAPKRTPTLRHYPQVLYLVLSRETQGNLLNPFGSSDKLVS